MSYVSQTTVYCGYTRYARVSHSRQWSNYNIGLIDFMLYRAYSFKFSLI